MTITEIIVNINPIVTVLAGTATILLFIHLFQWVCNSRVATDDAHKWGYAILSAILGIVVMLMYFKFIMLPALSFVGVVVISATILTVLLHSYFDVTDFKEKWGNALISWIVGAAAITLIYFIVYNHI